MRINSLKENILSFLQLRKVLPHTVLVELSKGNLYDGKSMKLAWLRKATDINVKIEVLV